MSAVPGADRPERAPAGQPAAGRAATPVQSAPAAPRRAAGGARSSQVLRGAAALYGSTVVTAALGFAYWAVAARLALPAEVGAAAAAIAAMQLVGSTCTLGLGSLLIAELGRDRSARFRLVSAALAVSSGTGLAVGTAGAAAYGAVVGGGAPLYGSVAGVALFGLGCAAQAATAVLDLALVGAGRAGWQLLRNAVFAAAKLVLLLPAAVVAQVSATAVFACWVAGAVLSVAVVLARSPAWRRWLRRPAGPAALRGLGGQAFGHHVINVAAHVPLLLLPMLVASVLGNARNAGFYLAMQIASFGWAVTGHLSTALFAVSAREQDRLRRELRLSLVVSVLVTVAGIGVCAVAGRWVLGLLGPAYPHAATALLLMVAMTLPSGIRALFIAVCRVRGRLGLAAVATVATSAVEIAAGAYGARWGVTGVAAGMLVSVSVQALLMWPLVAGAAGLRAWLPPAAPRRPAP
ncbi:MAG TPA: hypothetical protein VFY17_11720 [Pilimelia sp.]|nr:hypothetical protein [Pilimelia sp.]